MGKDPNVLEVLGKRLKEVRHEQKITRDFLAEKIDVSSRFLADVEAGKVGVSLSTLKKICDFLNVSSDYLLDIAPREDKRYDRVFNMIRKLPPEHSKNLAIIISAFSDSCKSSDASVDGKP